MNMGISLRSKSHYKCFDWPIRKKNFTNLPIKNCFKAFVASYWWSYSKHKCVWAPESFWLYSYIDQIKMALINYCHDFLRFTAEMSILVYIWAAFHLTLPMIASIICPCLTFDKRQGWNASRSIVNVKWKVAIVQYIYIYSCLYIYSCAVPLYLVV